LKLVANYEALIEINDAAHITTEGEVGAYLNVKLRIPPEVTDGGVEISPAIEADVTMDRWTAVGLSQAIGNWVASKGDIA
jgi:hypothetical protein